MLPWLCDGSIKFGWIPMCDWIPFLIRHSVLFVLGSPSSPFSNRGMQNTLNERERRFLIIRPHGPSFLPYPPDHKISLNNQLLFLLTPLPMWTLEEYRPQTATLSWRQTLTRFDNRSTSLTSTLSPASMSLFLGSRWIDNQYCMVFTARPSLRSFWIRYEIIHFDTNCNQVSLIWRPWKWPEMYADRRRPALSLNWMRNCGSLFKRQHLATVTNQSVRLEGLGGMYKWRLL